MTDLDARVAALPNSALKIAEAVQNKDVIAARRAKAELEQALRAELQKPAQEVSASAIEMLRRAMDSAGIPQDYRAPLIGFFCNETRLQVSTQEEITDAEKMAQTRYHVDKTNGGFWPYVVRCGTGTQVLHKGHLKSCLNVAQMLTGAFLDGAFVASRASKGEKT